MAQLLAPLPKGAPRASWVARWHFLEMFYKFVLAPSILYAVQWLLSPRAAHLSCGSTSPSPVACFPSPSTAATSSSAFCGPSPLPWGCPSSRSGEMKNGLSLSKGFQCWGNRGIAGMAVVLVAHIN